MRGDLAIILYEATKKDVEYVFGEYVAGYKESDDGLEVEFANGHPTRKFDLLIAADGWSSRTRRIAFPDLNDGCVKSLGQWGLGSLCPGVLLTADGQDGTTRPKVGCYWCGRTTK